MEKATRMRSQMEMRKALETGASLLTGGKESGRIVSCPGALRKQNSA